MNAPAGPRIAVIDDFQSVASSMSDWEGIGASEVTFFPDHLDTEQALIERLEPYSVIVAMRERTAFPARVLNRLPHLQLLVTTGRRNASIDVGAARDAGVVVCGTRGISSGVVELTWGLILAAARNLAAEDALIRAGGWQDEVGPLLAGKTLGLVGLGKLGARVARIAEAFDMDRIAWSPHLTMERAAEHDVRLVDKAELFSTSDVVSVHLVLGPTTSGIIGEHELRSMKSSAIFVNTARGPLVQEEVLLQAVRERWISTVALDVFNVEPLPPDDPWRSLPHTLLSPHLGYVSSDNYRVFYGDAVDDIQSFLEGTPIRQIHPPE